MENKKQEKGENFTINEEEFILSDLPYLTRLIS